jgi:hypothetical protein
MIPDTNKKSSVQDTKSLSEQKQIEPTWERRTKKKKREKKTLEHLSPDPESNEGLPAYMRGQ